MYTIRVDSGLRDNFVHELNIRGIGASVHFYPPVHHMTPYKGSEIKKDDLKVTEKIIHEIVTLPMYPQMGNDDVQYIVDSIRETLDVLGRN